ncbi:hypothetical protein C2U70_07915 [Bradyrhizobium guangdongense]|uniref:acyltransferase n=1 Tax=Bradyrhizobium guangdongense TaxID=1325090 RepID=UPI00112AB79C|nr:acyltransferase [Bradyrhizobium guangdongense]TPQ38921.1 hypothetical protein C2U70_07915 [Bradyrhizobium guangdongense]
MEPHVEPSDTLTVKIARKFFWWVDIVKRYRVILVVAVAGLAARYCESLSPWFVLVNTASLVAVVLWLFLKLRRDFRFFVAPLLAAVIFLGLMLSDQGVEAMRSIIQEDTFPQLGDMFLLAVFIFFFNSTLLGKAFVAINPESQSDLTGPQKFLFTLLTILPLGAVMCAWSLAGDVSRTPRFGGYLDLPGYFVSVAFFVCLVKLKDGFKAIATRAPLPDYFLPDTGWSPETRYIVFGFLLFYFPLLVGIIMIVGMYEVSWDVIPSVLVAGWLGFLVALAQAFQLLQKRWTSVPIVAILLIVALLLSVLDLNDNHELPFARSRDAPPAASEAFADWLKRFDAVHATAVVVVSEGGGARAAYMTAVALEALRSRCPAFAHRHFATIGVSGGSLGAALSSANPAGVPADNSCEGIEGFDDQSSAPIFAAGTDLLRPVVRGLLIADLPMRLWPSSFWLTNGEGKLDELQRPWVSATDRASYLGWRLDLAWRSMRPDDATRLRDMMFSKSWPGPTGDRPALILLSTDVTSGRRVAVSHLRFGLQADVTQAGCLSPLDLETQSVAERNRLLTMSDIAPGRDPTLLGAALASARFPIITPAATLPCPGPKWRLVDGGYFENSGLSTALDLVEHMARGAKSVHKAVRVVLVRIENGAATTNYDTVEGSRPKPPSQWLGEIMSPIRAFIGTREARADQARLATDRAVAGHRYGLGCRNGGPDGCVKIDQIRLELRPCKVKIPLGWSLSPGAREEIRKQLGVEGSEGDSDCVRSAAAANLAEIKRLTAMVGGMR